MFWPRLGHTQFRKELQKEIEYTHSCIIFKTG